MQISAQLYELIRLDLNFGEGAELDVETFLFCVSENYISHTQKAYILDVFL